MRIFITLSQQPTIDQQQSILLSFTRKYYLRIFKYGSLRI